MLLLDRHLPDLNVEELTRMVRLRYPGVDVRTIDGDVTRLPAAWHESPASADQAKTRPVGDEVGPLEGMVGRSRAMTAVYRSVRKVAARSTAVLVTGETGTGKELIAQAVHRLSPRNAKPLVVINCAAIPETLLESELFGYVRGAFTGAAQSRLGRIQSAAGGTLFLDEIGEMPVALQAKLLRFLESGELQRLGSTESWKADVRVVTATNRNLKQASVERTFREDLYYRLCVFPIKIPPLRERRDDILELAEHFLGQFSSRSSFDEAALAKLQAYDWPGNVRELRHVVERATILTTGSGLIHDADLVLDVDCE
jgi:transcriptional regulator with GAF, ATPase, and Fis domain